MLRLDRQHHKETARRDYGPKALPAAAAKRVVGAEQGEMPPSGTARADDRCRTGRPARHVGQRFQHRRRYFTGITLRPRRVREFLPPAQTLHTGPHRHNPNKTPPAGTLQEPPRQIHREHPQGDHLRRMERQRKVVKTLMQHYPDKMPLTYNRAALPDCAAAALPARRRLDRQNRPTDFYMHAYRLFSAQYNA